MLIFLLVSMFVDEAKLLRSERIGLKLRIDSDGVCRAVEELDLVLWAIKGSLGFR